MAPNTQQSATQPTGGMMPSGAAFHEQVKARRRRGHTWAIIFQGAMLSGIIALCALLITIVNQSFGYAAIVNEIDPAELAVDGVPLNELPKETLAKILETNISKGLMRRYENDMPFSERSRENIHELILERVVEPQVEATWGLLDSIFARGRVFAEAEARYPGSEVYFRSWLTTSFISKSQSSEPLRGRCAHCDFRLTMGRCHHHSVFFPDWSGCRYLFGRVRTQGALP